MSVLKSSWLLSYVSQSFEMHHGSFSDKKWKTALGPNEQSCGQVFYYDCGNRRCIREALTCDDYDNCGNNEDETSCGKTSDRIYRIWHLFSGLDALSASLLGGSAIISLVFLLVVLYLDNRPEVVIKLINERLIDDMEHHQVLWDKVYILQWNITWGMIITYWWLPQE